MTERRKSRGRKRVEWPAFFSPRVLQKDMDVIMPMAAAFAYQLRSLLSPEERATLAGAALHEMARRGMELSEREKVDPVTAAFFLLYWLAFPDTATSLLKEHEKEVLDSMKRAMSDWSVESVLDIGKEE